VRILAEKGVPVVAHVRPDSARLKQWQERFERLGARVDTTAWEEAAMAETMARIKPGYVFALLGTTRARARQVARKGRDPGTESYQAVDYGLTAMLVMAARAGGSSPCFVYLSAAGVKDNSRLAYYAARAKAEALLRESGLRYVIARPGIITGPGRDEFRLAERLAGILVDGILTVPAILGAKKLKARYGSITNTELAHSLVRLARDQAAADKIFESAALHIRPRSSSPRR